MRRCLIFRLSTVNIALACMVFLEVVLSDNLAYAVQKGEWAWPGNRFIVHAADPSLNLENLAEISCTVGFPATDTEGDRLFITAGHCGRTGDVIYSINKAGKDQQVGHILYSSSAQRSANNNIDVAVVIMNEGKKLDGENHHIEYTYNKDSVAAVHSLICMVDDLSKVNCSLIVGSAKNSKVRFRDNSVMNYRVFPTHLCSTQGDSGAPIYGARGAIGILTADFPAGQDCHNYPWLELGSSSGHHKQQMIITSYITPLADALANAEVYVPGLKII